MSIEHRGSRIDFRDEADGVTKMDGKRLRKLFIEFNEKYFGNGLPNYHIRVVDHITKLGASGICSRPRRLIRILRSLDEERAISTLIHEMAHAATSGHHGKAWRAEMVRLRNQGAPFSEADANVDMVVPKVTIAKFRSSVSDAF